MKHLLTDFIQSMIVILAGLVMYFYATAWWADPMLAYSFLLWNVYLTYTIFKKSIRFFMGNGSRQIDHEGLKQDIMNVGGSDVLDIHDLNLYQPSTGIIQMSVHIRSQKPMKTLAQVTDMCRKKHGIYDLAI